MALPSSMKSLRMSYIMGDLISDGLVDTGCEVHR
jgi:hypothetical protein